MRAPGGMPHPAIILSDCPQLLSVIEGMEAGTYPLPDDAIWREDLPLPARAESPRCDTCHRSAHWPGSPGYHGHAYRAPKTVRAEANRQYVRDLLADKQPAYAAALELAIAVLDTVHA